MFKKGIHKSAGIAAGLGLLLAACQAPVPAPPPPPFARVAAPPAPPAPAGPPAPLAVYRNPRIGVVYLRAHQDAAGRLLGPQVMYQIVDPGGWNLDALEAERALVPPANQEPAGGLGWPVRVAARPAPIRRPDDPLLDPAAAARIVITGWMRPEDRAAAEAAARTRGPGAAAVYDAQAGWLILPGPGKP